VTGIEPESAQSGGSCFPGLWLAWARLAWQAR